MDEKYFCGIDVSKKSFSVAVKNSQFLVDRQKFSMDRVGFEKLNALLSPYQERLLVGMESTGIYHTNLFYFLHKENLTHQIARTKTEIKRILSLVFPELERENAIFSSGLVSLLKVFPSAHSIRQTDEKKFIHQTEKLLLVGGRKLHFTPAQIYHMRNFC